jgi:molybdenum cofactor cytidylyltransferase
MASSIRAGIAAMPEEAEAMIIAMADQPTADPVTVDALILKWRTDGPAAVATQYHDGRGHPVLFARECFEALSLLRGDVGARSVLDALADRTALIQVDSRMPMDVDTPDVLRELEASLR